MSGEQRLRGRIEAGGNGRWLRPFGTRSGHAQRIRTVPLLRLPAVSRP